MKLTVYMTFLYLCFTSSSSSSTSQQKHASSQQSPSSVDNVTHHQRAGDGGGGAAVSGDHAKTIGVFLNFTREFIDYTNKSFPKPTNDQPLQFRSNEHQILLLRDDDEEDDDGDDGTDDTDDGDQIDVADDDEQDTEVRDLLSGILADEFDSVETIDKDIDDHDDDHHQDIFHDDKGDDDDDDVTVVEKDHDFVKVRTDHVLHNGTVTTSTKDRTGRARQGKVSGAGHRPGKGAAAGGTRGKGKKNGKKQVDVAKYNGYVDAVFKRMNSLIRAKRMDPLRVNLFAGKQTNGGGGGSGGAGNGNGVHKKSGGLNKNNKNKKSPGHHGGKTAGAAGHNNNRNNNKKNKGGKGGKKRNQPHNHHQHQRRGPKVDDEQETEDMEEIDVQVRRERKVRSDNVTQTVMTDKMRPVSVDAQTNRSSSSVAPTVESSSDSSVTSPSSSSSSESTEVKDKDTKRENPNRPTRGVLHGLSTLRRAGPVKVLRRGADVRLVRAKFLLGPVALDILPKKSSNGTKSANMPTATATARSLNGVLEIRLKNAGPTRIRKLRVFPPANVRVEGEGENKNNGMKKQGYRKVTPVAARRLMSVANQVVRQTGRLRNKAKNNKRGGSNSNTKRKGSSNVSNNNHNVHIKRRYH